ncbi:glycosyltransferase family 4 protein (plasmid) [Pedobacter sp. BS3]|uniref:MraY family glycosyltransferase n=1 Tax=Pedobacter sp. BS3 TaxID=2567937 RepID=UPI0011ECF115|nr:glycosyltransferase family 4 protein [Pedobacter sp. BS3]TZF86455.1 glycosyltransferase family 4 protein [Pedobacter sp. BS3]
MNLLLIIGTILFFFIVETVYFRIADRYNIIDKPNHRSSHSSVTIRGGGILFPIAVLVFSGYSGWTYPYFTIGLLAIAAISFLDDIYTLDNKIRLVVHLAAVALLFYQLDIYQLSLFWLLPTLIFVIGTINAYNFMDGINGITGGYSLVTLLTLWYINEKVQPFGSSTLMIVIILSLLVFNYFNFRKTARCFAGDVGSVSMAFIILFFLGQLLVISQNPVYIFLLLLYGLDAVTTICFRLIRKENIFKAHRSHVYQFLANTKKWPHVWVSISYMIVQLIINLFIISYSEYFRDSLLGCVVFLLITTILFIGCRLIFEGKKYLFGEVD